MNLDARKVAYELLEQVATSDAYANLVFPELVKQFQLDKRDAAFATELAMGTLRWSGFLDSVISLAAGREIDRIDPPLRDLLRLGAYQLLFMRVPSHAAVSSTVDLVVWVGKTSAKGLVNAALRRIAEIDLPTWQERVIANAPDELTSLSIRYSHPRWEVAALRDALQERRDSLPALLQVNNTSPQVTAVSRTGRPIGAELPAGQWSPLAGKIQGDPGALAGIRNGSFGVQDEGSQLVVLAALASPVSEDAGNWLDLCAGPGGKAALIASLGAKRLTAVEPIPVRANLVRQALRNASCEVEVVEADGRDSRFSTESFDRVFVDAPCSGLGVLRRRAESRWRRTPQDVSRLASLQRELLESAFAAVKHGGLISYSTCSPHLAETEFVVEDLLKRHPELELVDARESALNIEGLLNRDVFAELTGPGPYLRLWPHLHDTDGMFLALLRRR